MKTNKKKVLIVLDIIYLLLCVVAVIVFTGMFRFIQNDFRYLFLLGDLYVIYTFSNTLSSYEKENYKRVIKYSHPKVEAKYLKKISI